MDGQTAGGGPPHIEAPAPGGKQAAGTPTWEAEFAELLQAVETAAREWGVRSDSLEGRFVTAFMGTVKWLGRLTATSQSGMEAIARQSRAAAEVELAQAREITRAANAALGQARSAQIALQVEQETLVARMINATLPLFAERLQGALVLREKRWNDDVRRRRYAMAGVVTLGLFFGGYAMRSWQDDAAVRLLGQCMAHPVPSNGRIYCDATGFGQ